jgi:hypothetical protein
MELSIQSAFFKAAPRILAVFVLLVAITGARVHGQAAAPSSNAARPIAVPVSHLYWHFLILQNHLDRVAAVREQSGQDGSAFRSYYQNKLGFSDTEFVPVRESAQRLEPALKTIDAEVKAVIDADHARHPRLLASPKDLPPVPPELLELQRKREQAIEYEVQSLKAALGKQQAAKLETFLTQEFAHNVTAHQVSLPRPHDPIQHPVPRFPQQEGAQ